VSDRGGPLDPRPTHKGTFRGIRSSNPLNGSCTVPRSKIPSCHASSRLLSPLAAWPIGTLRSALLHPDRWHDMHVHSRISETH
jgi:hypothetical protein